MVLLQEQNSSNWADVEFLTAANKQLVECRKVLKYSYAFAFYLEEGDKKTRFEYHQEMLERFTEHLSELSEKPIQEMNRTEVVNQVRFRILLRLPMMMFCVLNTNSLFPFPSPFRHELLTTL